LHHTPRMQSDSRSRTGSSENAALPANRTDSTTSHADTSISRTSSASPQGLHPQPPNLTSSKDGAPPAHGSGSPSVGAGGGSEVEGSDWGPPATKHTPGPWRVCNEGKCGCCQIWSTSADEEVACSRGVACVHREWGDAPGMVYGGVPLDECKANALLIAAAPDLREALFNILLHDVAEPTPNARCHVGIVPMESCVRCQRVTRALAALAKAAGR
jgi:hypothetical protein